MRIAFHRRCLALICAFGLIQTCTLAQSESYLSKIDSLTRILTETTNDTLRLEVLIDLADISTTNAPDAAITYVDEALELSRELNDDWYITYLLHLKSVSLADQGNYDEAIDCMERAIEGTYHEMQDADDEWRQELSCELTNYYNNLGYYYFEQGDYMPAVDYLLKSMNVGEENACPDVALTYGSIAELYFALGDVNRARGYLNRVLATDSIAHLYEISILGDILIAEGKPDSALHFYQTMLDQNLPGNQNYNTITALNGLASAYLALDQATEAEARASASHALATEIQSQIYLAEATRIWGRALIMQGRIEEGQEKISSSIVLARDIQSISQLMQSYEICADFFSANGDYRKAFDYQSQASILRDSITGIDRTRLVLQSTMSRELEQREIEASDMQAQIAHDQEVIRRSNSFGIAMLLFGLAVAFVTYLTMRLRRGKIDKPRNDFYHHRTDNPARFFYRIILGVIVLLIPILIHSIVWGNQRVTLAISTVLIINTLMLVFITDKRLHWLVVVFMPVAYVMIALTPMYIGPLQVTVLAIPAVFLVMAYTIEDYRVQIANGICASAAFITYQLLLPHSVPMIEGNPPGLEFMLGIMSLGVVFTAMYYYHGQIRDYRGHIEASNTFLSQIANANPHFIYAKDLGRRFTFANRTLSETFDEDPESIIGQREEDILSSYKTDTHFREDDETVLKTGTTLKIDEERILTKKGEVKWLETIKQPIFSDEGEITGLLGVSLDITEERKVQQELKESLSLLTATFESTADGLLVVNMNNEVIQYNEKFIEIWGLSSEILQRSELEALEIASTRLADPKQFRSKVDEIYSDPAVVTFDTLVFKNGRIYERYSQPQRIANRIVGRVWSFRDVTDRVKANENLRASEERYRLLFETTFDGFAILRDGEIVDANQSAIDLLGYPNLATLQNKSIVTIFPSLAQRPMFARILGGEMKNTPAMQLSGRNFSGEVLNVEISMCEMVIQDNRHVACAIRNIAEKVTLEKKEIEIATQKTEMEALNREIASYALLSSHKHRLLSEIKAEISDAAKLNGDPLNKAIARVNRKIDSNINEGEDMVAFKIQFEKVHPNFFNRLMQINPKLTNNDLKYCAYIRLNMSTQDICDLLFVERKTVEMTKYRIKKKFGLKKEERLSEFIYAI